MRSSLVLQKLLLIAVAGGLGAISRYGLSGLVHSLVGRTFPWGTVVVNVAGCFVFGLLWAAMEDRLSLSGQTRSMILIGFMGSFTTFSTYVFETQQLLEDSQWLPALANFSLQNVAGLVAVVFGMAVGRFV
jgi:CrcB protein